MNPELINIDMAIRIWQKQRSLEIRTKNLKEVLKSNKFLIVDIERWKIRALKIYLRLLYWCQITIHFWSFMLKWYEMNKNGTK